jgi:hypothetical protein
MNWVTNPITSFVDGVRSTAGSIGSSIGSMTGLSYTVDLNSNYLLKMLAVCAEESYYLEENRDNLSKYDLVLIKSQKEYTGSGNALQYGIFKIKSGEFADETILAFRGTASAFGIIQDADIFFPGPKQMMRTIIQYANDVALNNNVNWICGHSLGGLIAEAVCSHTGVGGASFNAPGPWSSNLQNNLADGDKYKNVAFEIHLTKNDGISFSGSAGGPDSSHIGKPKWHDHGGGHSMECLRKDIETF